MGKTQTVSLDEQIRLAEKTLSDLKQKKEDEEAKNSVIETRFENLPKSIENIAAHICIRRELAVIVIFDFTTATFQILDPDNFHCWFNNYEKCISDGVGCLAEFDINDDESFMEFGKYFGCKFVFVEKDMYQIEPLKVDTRSGEIILEED